MARIPRIVLNLSKNALESVTSREKTRHVEELSPENIHHLFTVLRCTPSCLVELTDPAHKITLRSTIISREQCAVEFDSILAQQHEVNESIAHPRHLRLLIGIPKLSALEDIVEKGTELGLNEIVLFPAERSQAAKKIDWSSKLTRLERIANEALKQCEGSTLPSISVTESLDEALGMCAVSAPDSTPSGLFVLTPEREEFCALPSPAPLNELLKHRKSPTIPVNSTAPTGLQSELQQTMQVADFTLIVGPEGGLTSEEVQRAVERGFTPASLGARILRVETAAIVASGIILLAS